MESYEIRLINLQSGINKEFDLDKRISMLKRGITVADANSDLKWGTNLRLQLIGNERCKTKLTDSFPAFTWLLNVYETNSELINTEDILIIYKDLAMMSFRYADISLEQIWEIFDGFKVKLSNAGLGLRDYYEILACWYIFIGERQQARQCLINMQIEPLDQISSDLSKSIEVHICLLENKTDQAVSLTENHLRDNTLIEGEATSMFFALSYYLSKYKDERAKLYFDKMINAFNEIKNIPFSLYFLPSIFLYLALNNKELGWYYFEQYGGLETEGDDTHIFDVTVSLLPLFKGSETRQLNLSAKAPFYRADNTYNTEDIFRYYYNTGMQMAERFDQRYGGSHYKEQIEEFSNL